MLCCYRLQNPIYQLQLSRTTVIMRVSLLVLVQLDYHTFQETIDAELSMNRRPMTNSRQATFIWNHLQYKDQPKVLR